VNPPNSQHAELQLEATIADVFAILSSAEMRALRELEPSGAATSVGVDFRGPLSGRLTLQCTRDLVDELTRTLLALEAEPTDRERLDTLGEVANILCGNLLPRLCGATYEFRVLPPDQRVSRLPVLAVNRMHFGSGDIEVSLQVDAVADGCPADAA
jgi:CheY-specific phosphatase CheX